MHRFLWTCSALALLAVNGWAEEPSPEQAKAEQRLYDTLRDVLNQGADLYNSGDPNGCYRLFEGAMKTALPQLDHRPDLQRMGETVLEDAARQRTAALRAWKLHDALEDIRLKIKPRKGPPIVDPADATLWQRLGGDKNMTKVVDDFIDRLVDDPMMDFTRNGKVKLGEADMAKLRRHVTNYLSEIAKGKDRYDGGPLKEVFEDLGVTEREYNEGLEHFRTALGKNNVKAKERDELLRLLEPIRADIVQTVKPPDKKPDPPEEKPEEKPTEKKPEEKPEERPEPFPPPPPPPKEE